MYLLCMQVVQIHRINVFNIFNIKANVWMQIVQFHSINVFNIHNIIAHVPTRCMGYLSTLYTCMYLWAIILLILNTLPKAINQHYLGRYNCVNLHCINVLVRSLSNPLMIVFWFSCYEEKRFNKSVRCSKISSAVNSVSRWLDYLFNIWLFK